MKLIKFSSLALIAFVIFSCNKNGISKKSLNTEIDSVSYALGVDIATKVNTNFTEVDTDLLVQGFLNSVDSSNVLIESDKIEGVLASFFQKKQAETMKKQQEAAAAQAEIEFAEVKTAGEAFIEENKTKEGVQVTESGLQYIVLKEGDGEKPAATNTVKVHYHGTLIDGTVFDSSVDRGEPAQFGVSQVIPGWIEGLQLMSVGSKFKFFIPQNLAYGATPRPGGPIKPFAPLVFEVELLEIVN